MGAPFIYKMMCHCQTGQTTKKFHIPQLIMFNIWHVYSEYCTLIMWQYLYNTESFLNLVFKTDNFESSIRPISLLTFLVSRTGCIHIIIPRLNLFHHGGKRVNMWKPRSQEYLNSIGSLEIQLYVGTIWTIEYCRGKI